MSGKAHYVCINDWLCRRAGIQFVVSIDWFAHGRVHSFGTHSFTGNATLQLGRLLNAKVVLLFVELWINTFIGEQTPFRLFQAIQANPLLCVLMLAYLSSIGAVGQAVLISNCRSNNCQVGVLHYIWMNGESVSTSIHWWNVCTQFVSLRVPHRAPLIWAQSGTCWVAVDGRRHDADVLPFASSSVVASLLCWTVCTRRAHVRHSEDSSVRGNIWSHHVADPLYTHSPHLHFIIDQLR